jgi:glycine hydroxymethyltransferase
MCPRSLFQSECKFSERLAVEHRPKMLVAGASAHSRIIDFERLARIAERVSVIFFVDMAHIAGLVAAGIHHISGNSRWPAGSQYHCQGGMVQGSTAARVPGLSAASCGQCSHSFQRSSPTRSPNCLTALTITYFPFDLQLRGLTGEDAESALHGACITVNKNAIPFDPFAAIEGVWHPARAGP